jgi:hypothetical protein
MSESNEKAKRKLAAASGTGLKPVLQPQVLAQITVSFHDNGAISLQFPDTQDRRIIANYVKMLLDAINILVTQRLAVGEGGRILVPPGVMNG